jgi:hypothetical protein
MSNEHLERYESEAELRMYEEYRDVLPLFKYAIDTERRYYLANEVEVEERERNGAVFFEVFMQDAWVWDMYRPARFLKTVRVWSFRDVNVETLEQTPRT